MSLIPYNVFIFDPLKLPHALLRADC